MSDLDLLLAKAQVGLAVLMSLGFLATLFVLILLHNTLAPVENSLLSGLTGVLGTIVTQQSGYFFARQRIAGLTNPNGKDGPLDPPKENT